MGQVNVGVIGLGMGSYHAKNYLACPEARLLAVCDTNEAWLKHCQKEWKVPHAFADADEMLALPELQAISIATPPFLHKELTLKALARGLHVLCEKPLALNAPQAREMVAAAKQAGRFLMTHYNQRFSDTHLTIKRLMDTDVLGEIYFGRAVWQRRWGMPPPVATWRATGDYVRTWAIEKDRAGGGPLLDLGVHMLDLAWWLMGRPSFKDALASTYAKFGPEMAKQAGISYEVEDLAAGFIRFENGASLELETSWASHIESEQIFIELCGTKAGISTRGGKLRLFHNLGGLQATTEITERAPAPSPQAHFVQSILKQTPPDPSGEDGLAAMEMLDAMYRSAETR